MSNFIATATSPRWQAAIATVLGLLAADVFGLNLSGETIAGVVGMMASIIVSHGIRQPEKPASNPNKEAGITKP